MAMAYHVAVGGEKRGPYGVAELRRRFEAGEFPAESLYWRRGWREWRRLDRLSADDLVELLVREERRATAAGGWRPVVLGAALVLAVGVAAYGIVSRIERAETRRRAELEEHARQAREYQEKLMRESAAAVRAVQQRAEEELEAVRRQRQSALIDQDARLLAGAAQQYFMESCLLEVALSYDPRTGALSGPVAEYLPRIGAGYTEVPARLTVRGVFRLAHPAAGPVRRYHEDGRPAPEGAE